MSTAVVHPLVDASGPGFVVSRSDRAVLGLSPLRADLLVSAAAARSRVVLVTGSHARLTDPLRDALATAGGAWVAEEPSGDLSVATTGRAIAAPEEALAPAGPEGPVDAFLRPPTDPTVQLLVSASLRHRPEASLRLGRAVETLAGAPPAGWGPHEPVERDWDLDALTGHLRDLAPSEARVVVAGTPSHPLAGTLLARRTDRGVEEVLQVVLALGRPGSPEADAGLASVPQRLAALARHGMPLMALAFARPGRADLTTSATLQAPPEPVAMLLGPPAVRDLGIDPGDLEAEFAITVVGSPRVPGVVLGFDTGPDRWATFARLMARLDPAAVARATGRDLLQGGR